MNYREYTERAFLNAKKHGFHDKKLSYRHFLMLVISEVAEMVEADRKGKSAQVEMFKREINTPQPEENKQKHWVFCFETFIKDSVGDEMADVCIRLFDLAGYIGFVPGRLNIIELLMLRLFSKKTFTEKAYKLCRTLSAFGSVKNAARRTLGYLEYWAKLENIDLEWHIEQKIKYNELRQRMHGKKY